MTTILIDKNVIVAVRDGVRLATNIHRFEGATPTAVLVVRTPYNKDQIVTGNDVFDILRTVQAGYTVVTQDVRGRYASEGSFKPHVQETADGLDAFAWAAAQQRAIAEQADEIVTAWIEQVSYKGYPG